jgi:hypothetical protein
MQNERFWASIKGEFGLVGQTTCRPLQGTPERCEGASIFTADARSYFIDGKNDYRGQVRTKVRSFTPPETQAISSIASDRRTRRKRPGSWAGDWRKRSAWQTA